MKNLLLRALTGFFYVTIIVVGIVSNSYSFLALFSFVVVLCLYEFYGLMNDTQETSINRVIHASGGLLLFLSQNPLASNVLGSWGFYLYLLYIFSTFTLSLYQKGTNPLKNLASIFLGQVYIAVPLTLLNLIAYHPFLGGSGEYVYVMVLALFVFIWVNDTGAYLIGVKFGKHRLFERISPKKSWEGFFGGLFFTILSSLIFFHYQPFMSVYHWMILAAIIVVFATWGDLVESLIKRTIGVKDSGNALPGHGGFLDRFDSLLLAIYGMLFYLSILSAL